MASKLAYTRERYNDTETIYHLSNGWKLHVYKEKRDWSWVLYSGTIMDDFCEQLDQGREVLQRFAVRDGLEAAVKYEEGRY